MTKPVTRPEDLPRTTSDGIEIIETQQGLAEHPHPRFEKALVPFRYLEELLLADGTTRYRCTKPLNGVDGPLCGRDDFTSAKSTVSHANSHGREARPIYAEETLRLLVRLCRTYEIARHRNYCERTAAELNRRGVPTVHGEPWNAEQVSHLFNQYRDRFRTHVRQAQVERRTDRPDPATQPAKTSPKLAQTPRSADTVKTEDTVNLAALDRRSADLVTRAGQLFDAQRKFTEDLADFVQDVGAAMTRAATRAPDPDLVAKAARWDQVKNLLGGS